jgi:hypothetical protein
MGEMKEELIRYLFPYSGGGHGGSAGPVTVEAAPALLGWRWKKPVGPKRPSGPATSEERKKEKWVGLLWLLGRMPKKNRKIGF